MCYRSHLKVYITKHDDTLHTKHNKSSTYLAAMQLSLDDVCYNTSCSTSVQYIKRGNEMGITSEDFFA